MVTFDLDNDINKYLCNKKGVNGKELLASYEQFLGLKADQDNCKFIKDIDSSLDIYNILNVKDRFIKLDDDSFSLTDIFAAVYDKSIEMSESKGTKDPYVRIRPDGKRPVLMHYKGLMTLTLLVMLARSCSFRNLDIEDDVIITTTNNKEFKYLTKEDPMTSSINFIYRRYIALARALSSQQLFTSEMIKYFAHSVCRSSTGEELDLIKQSE